MFVYTIVFLTDYLFYVKQPSSYVYVSRRTWLLFTAGQASIIVLFWADFQPYIAHAWTELLFLGLLTSVVTYFTYALNKENAPVCYVTARTERCLSPGYVIVKGSEIVFQQLVYVAIAVSLVTVVGLHWLTYVLYMIILSIIHAPVVIDMDRSVRKILVFGLTVISAPIFYVYAELQYFFPAVYLHSMMYVFYWLTFADFGDD